MKILVAVLTRGNPLGLVTLIGGLDALKSGNHEVAYVVRYDEDDGCTNDGLWLLKSYGVSAIAARQPRPSSLGAAWNEAIAVAPKWDIAVPFPGDIVPLCVGWDLVCAEAMRGRDAFSWWQTCAPQDAMYPTISRRWYEAAGGRMFCEWFPFWFTDHWFWEVHAFAMGGFLPIVNELVLGGRHEKTSRMRDLAFWFGFFRATRPMRRLEGSLIRERLGQVPLAVEVCAAAVAEMERRDEWQRVRIPEFEERYGGSPDEPDERYMQARAAAEEILTFCARAA